ncbi:MAG: hypothetical protein SO357_09495, partial [Absicoccus porci]
YRWAAATATSAISMYPVMPMTGIHTFLLWKDITEPMDAFPERRRPMPDMAAMTITVTAKNMISNCM